METPLKVSFIVALASGVLLLFWYVPNVEQAYESLEQLDGLGQWVRSLHRYSSDATIFFVLIHAVRMLLARRFGGARWLAWVTGAALLAMLWFVGWLGYWLVWDVRAQTLAVGTAEVLEILPIFTEPLTRTFLTDEAADGPHRATLRRGRHRRRTRRQRALCGRALADDAQDAQKAVVDTKLCNGCTLCVEDCPYNAIVMVPRKDGRDRYKLQAELDPVKCVGCGICAGACNPGGIGLPQVPVQETRRQIDQWIDTITEEGDEPLIAFLCGNSAGSHFRVDADGHCDELPGYRVVPVPCSGWVHMLTVERALRRGAAGVLIVGCAESEPPYREGTRWTKLRLGGQRKPALRSDKIDASGVRFVAFNRTEPHKLVEAARQHRRDCLGEAASDGVDSSGGDSTAPAGAVESSNGDSTAARVAAGVVIAALLALPVVGLSDAPSLVPVEREPELVVSVKHRPEAVEDCRELTDEEASRTMKHMQNDQICERSRPDVRLEVRLEETVYPAKGLSSDRPGIGTERFRVAPGEHRVSVRIGHSENLDEWTHRFDETLTFEEGSSRVINFETKKGFVVAGR